MNKKIYIVLGIIIAGALGWYFIAPLFIDTVVDESFPETEVSQNTDTTSSDEGIATPTENDEIVPEFGTGISVETEIAFPQKLLSGQFEDVDIVHKGVGTATLYQLEDGSRIVRFEDFEVTNGPDLRVLLSNNARPRTQSEVKDNGYIELGSLKGSKGNQNYTIPADVDIEAYNSVVIYCYPFKVVFSTATIQ